MLSFLIYCPVGGTAAQNFLSIECKLSGKAQDTHTGRSLLNPWQHLQAGLDNIRDCTAGELLPVSVDEIDRN